jgi:hypothetical protein
MELTRSIYSLMRGGSKRESRGGWKLQGDVDEWEMTNFPLLPPERKTR